MRVLVACEYSGRVRDAFIARGHDAISCDLLPTDAPGPHYQGSVFDIVDYPFDLMIAHPPCTHLSVSGSRHFAAKKMDGRQYAGASFFMKLVRRSEHIPMTAIENPVCIMSTLYKKPDQIIQPWQFGHGETKATCLWLKGLSKLEPTSIVDGRENRIHKMPPSKDRGKLRSETYHGIADAMAELERVKEAALVMANARRIIKRTTMSNAKLFMELHGSGYGTAISYCRDMLGLDPDSKETSYNEMIVFIGEQNK